MNAQELIQYADNVVSKGESKKPMNIHYWRRFYFLLELTMSNSFRRGRMVGDDLFDGGENENAFNALQDEIDNLKIAFKETVIDMIDKQLTFPEVQK